MKTIKSAILILLIGLPGLFFYSHIAETKDVYLTTVNETCGTHHGCGLCHIDPKGGGSLSFDGLGFSDAGRNPHYFCP